MNRVIRICLLTVSIGLINTISSSANDVQIKISKTSLQIVLDKMIEARAFSYGSTSSKAIVNYYGYKPTSATLELFSGNSFSVTFSGEAIANFQLGPFSFDLPGLSNQVIVVNGDVTIVNEGTGYKIVLTPTSFTDQTSNWLSGAINFTSLLLNLPEISTGADLPFLADAATSFFTSATPTLTTTSDEVTIGYTLKAGPRFVTVQNQVNGKTNIGSIQKVDGISGSTITTYDSPNTFEWSTGTTNKVQTPYELIDEANGKNKYRHWVNDENDVQTEIATRRIQYSVGTKDEVLEAKFDPARRVELDNSLEGGAFSNGTVTYDGSSYFSFDDYDFYDNTVSKTIDANVSNGTQGTDWVFWKWSDGNENKQRSIIINQDIDLKAEFKGNLRSNDSGTFKTYQRKIVRSLDGWEHMMYESLGNTWYEAKAPSGNWEFIESQNELHMGNGTKSPSIAVKPTTTTWPWQYMTVAAWQDGTNIRLQTFRYNSSSGTYVNAAPYEIISTGQSASYDTQPNVIWTDDDDLVLLYRTSSGIQYRIYEFDYPNVYLNLMTSGTVSSTSGANNIAATSITSSTANNTFISIAWEEDMGISGAPYYWGTEIKYASIRYITGATSVTVAVAPMRVSSGSVVRNKEPSIISTQTGTHIIGWISGITTNSSWGSPYDTKATVATLTACPWGICTSRSNLDHHVRSVSVNKLSDNSEAYVGWSQIYDQSGYIDYNKFVEKSALSTFKTLNTKGWDLQLTGASSDNDIYAFSFYPKSQPYYWLQSNSLGSYLKQAPLTATQSRSLVLSDTAGTAGFSIGIGELYVDGQPIAFIPLPEYEPLEFDEVQPGFQGVEDVEPYLTTEPFHISKNTKFTFDEQFSFGDSLSALQFLGSDKRVSIQINLVDDASNELIATLREFTIDGKRGLTRQKKSWSVNTNTLEEGNVRVELMVQANFEGLKAEVETSYSDDFARGKVQVQDYEELEPIQDEQPVEFILSQNYPNPFNPSTQIEYAIPTTGLVKLEVFDILGRKVRMLVNDVQEVGRYTVTFNASDLASGVYVYRLTSGDFTATKQLYLLK
ncbi:MAG: T9SS C-terminal target domain-containing protein [Balneola sp.]|nr:MAG: T9SS C-terminal target domain-containing protein [Balneola sp.]